MTHGAEARNDVFHEETILAVLSQELNVNPVLLVVLIVDGHLFNETPSRLSRTLIAPLPRNDTHRILQPPFLPCHRGRIAASGVVPLAPPTVDEIHCRERLGGLLKSYHRKSSLTTRATNGVERICNPARCPSKNRPFRPCQNRRRTGNRWPTATDRFVKSCDEKLHMK